MNPVRWAFRVAVTPGYWSAGEIRTAKEILEAEAQYRDARFFRGLVNAAAIMLPAWGAVVGLGWYVWG
jgi:hypothetical protein